MRLLPEIFGSSFFFLFQPPSRIFRSHFLSEGASAEEFFCGSKTLVRNGIFFFYLLLPVWPSYTKKLTLKKNCKITLPYGKRYTRNGIFSASTLRGNSFVFRIHEYSSAFYFPSSRFLLLLFFFILFESVFYTSDSILACLCVFIFFLIFMNKSFFYIKNITLF